MMWFSVGLQFSKNILSLTLCNVFVGFSFLSISFSRFKSYLLHDLLFAERRAHLQFYFLSFLLSFHRYAVGVIVVVVAVAT